MRSETPTPPTSPPGTAQTSQLTLTLDTLLSPAGTPDASFTRDSVVESDLSEVGLDGSRFSNVSLNARDSMTAIKSPAEETTTRFSEDGRRTTIAIGQTSSVKRASFTQHRKSASTASGGSSTQVSFLMQRLDLQRSQDETDSKSSLSQRSSLDGQQKLREEFDRLHYDHDGHGGIDWGKLISLSMSFKFMHICYRILGCRYVR